ncbi:putative F-box protein At3g49980 [Capsella rubella]|uniref:putative F-box protein At3g49980 n=1 Tax=Capsella rubella TaxID=81985 RepID=UPI000CD50490|nr:putative F-box protein At3g49980 [Capsella rubella]
MSELPRDLLEEILCRVPATSLKRFRSTCKQWNRLLNDKKFLKKHCDKAAKHYTVLSLTDESRLCLLNVNFHSGVPNSLEVTWDELSLIDQSKSHQVNIKQVFHCDGLLLCTIKDNTIFVVVWNPCTGQTKWIPTSKDCSFHDFVLGYHQDKQTGNKSYRILSYKSYHCGDQEFQVYDIDSNSWRSINVTPIPNYNFAYPYYRVSLNGKTYWFGVDEKEEELGLISFDYATERLERLHLPYQFYRYDDLYLSVVGEEKLLVLLQREHTSRKEIWVTTNKIDDETKDMSWSKLLEVEVATTGHESWLGISFLVHEKKNVVLFCEKRFFNNKAIKPVSIVEEDDTVKNVDFRVRTRTSCRPYLVDYVPSLIQIEQHGSKRRRGQ